SKGCTKLIKLHIRRCEGITFFAMNWLSGLPELAHIDISNCNPLTSEEAPIVRLPKLQSLKLVGCGWVGEVVMMALSQGCPLLPESAADHLQRAALRKQRPTLNIKVD